MNYLERLIRRALLEAPRIAGLPPENPFETEAIWPLETPNSQQDRAEPDVVWTAAEPSRSAPLRESKPESRAGHPAVPDFAFVPAEVSQIADIEPSTRVVPPLRPIEEAATAVATKIRLSLPKEEATALSQADSFMRALGVPLPLLPPESLESANRVGANPVRFAATELAAATDEPNVQRKARQAEPRTNPARAPAQTILPQPAAAPPEVAPASRNAPHLRAESANPVPAAQPRPAGSNPPAPAPAVRVAAVPAGTELSAGSWFSKSARFGLGQL